MKIKTLLILMRLTFAIGLNGILWLILRDTGLLISDILIKTAYICFLFSFSLMWIGVAYSFFNHKKMKKALKKLGSIDLEGFLYTLILFVVLFFLNILLINI